ncbi:MAG: trypsin-like serine protease [Acidimicrobiales bacterium]
MPNLRRTTAVALLAVVALLATATMATAITGGTDDDPLDPAHPNVGLVYFYQSDGRFRCSGTLIDPQVFLTAAHCTAGDVGKVAVSFDTQVAPDLATSRQVAPRALDDDGTGLVGSGYDDGLWIVEYDADGVPLEDPNAPDGIKRHAYDNTGFDDGTADGSPIWVTGTAIGHPDYSDFTDMKNWNDTGVVVLDEPIAGITPADLAPVGYLDAFTQGQLVKELIHTVGYGTEVRSSEGGPQKPAPMSFPLRRQMTDEKPQKLTPQILQMNGNDHDPFGGGGTCFGDSGGPAFHGGYVVGDTSYGYTSNCRYLGGYQRVDIAVVHSWLTCVVENVGLPAAEIADECGSFD